MRLIYCALLCEAQAFIEYYKLSMVLKKQIYINDNIIVIVGGIGKSNMFKLENIFQNYSIHKAFNIGIAGVNSLDVAIGSLHSSTHNLDKLPLKTVESVQIDNDENNPTMYDMEGKYFLEICKMFLNEKDIFIFKVISDHLDDTILPKDLIKKMIQKNIKKLDEYIR